MIKQIVSTIIGIVLFCLACLFALSVALTWVAVEETDRIEKENAVMEAELEKI